jgi:hypothetical protein
MINAVAVTNRSPLGIRRVKFILFRVYGQVLVNAVIVHVKSAQVPVPNLKDTGPSPELLILYQSKMVGILKVLEVLYR